VTCLAQVVCHYKTSTDMMKIEVCLILCHIKGMDPVILKKKSRWWKMKRLL